MNSNICCSHITIIIHNQTQPVGFPGSVPPMISPPPTCRQSIPASADWGKTQLVSFVTSNAKPAESLNCINKVTMDTVQWLDQSSTLCEQGRNMVDTMVGNTRTKVEEVVEYYHYLMSIGDKRVTNWGLMQSPAPTIAITCAYLLSMRSIY